MKRRHSMANWPKPAKNTTERNGEVSIQKDWSFGKQHSNKIGMKPECQSSSSRLLDLPSHPRQQC